MGRAGRFAALAALAALTLAACGDEGAGVRTINGTSSASGSGSGTTAATGVSSGFGGYEPVSDVAAHAKVTADVCAISEALPSDGTPDYATATALYAEGKNSVKSDGAKRTLKGFATEERDERIWDTYVAYYDDEAWLDTYVSAALAGTGPFQGAADGVRRQGIQKGTQNQILVAWTVHELVAAEEKVAAGETDKSGGAPHAVDEAWAFYHGERAECAPFATAAKRGAEFGVGDAVNEEILKQMKAAQEAAIAGDAAKLRAANDEIVRQISITYLQAAIKYATKMSQAVEAGNADEARVQQAEGYSFYRVIEPLVAEADAAAAKRIAGHLELDAEPSAKAGEEVEAAVRSVIDDLGISAAQLGTFTG